MPPPSDLAEAEKAKDWSGCPKCGHQVPPEEMGYYACNDCEKEMFETGAVWEEPEPCQFGIHCKRRDTCPYAHPRCKFGDHCKRRDTCKFDH